MAFRSFFEVPVDVSSESLDKALAEWKFICFHVIE
jgi:hypothetical protein